MQCMQITRNICNIISKEKKIKPIGEKNINETKTKTKYKEKHINLQTS